MGLVLLEMDLFGFRILVVQFKILICKIIRVKQIVIKDTLAKIFFAQVI